RKEFELLRHLAANAFPWAAEDVIREIETFASRKTFMKLAGGVKRQLLEQAARDAPKGLVVELGSYVGYSAAILAMARGAIPLPPSPDQAKGRRTAAKSRMPVKIVKQDDLRRQYPPNGIPTAKNQTADDFLFQACQYSVSMGNLDRAIKKGANVNARNKDGNTPLMLACQNWTGSQFLPFINKLLESKADVNVESGWGFTPLDKVTELLKDQEAARLQEIRAQEERREIMEGRSIVGYGYGTAEEQRQHLVPNQPLADELDTFKCLPQLRECKKLLEQKGAKPGENPFNPAYLTTEEFVERRDAILEKYKDAKFKYSGH
ncbi:Ankrd53, partial [Symbiodinium sp. KB8]